MKGALETLADYMYLIIAIIVGGLMLYFIAHYSGLFGETQDVNVHGNGDEVSKRIAEEVKSCWEAHRNGLDPTSDVCIELKVNSTQAFSEWSMTKYLDCKAIPDNDCLPANCSACTSDSYDDRDKVGWDVKNKVALLSISYDGYERKIMVEEVGQEVIVPPQNKTPGNQSNLSVSINLPKDGDRFKLPALINFSCSITGGVSPYQISWISRSYLNPSSFTDTAMGSSQIFNRSDLGEGTYTIIVSVKDSTNQTASSVSHICVWNTTPCV